MALISSVLGFAPAAQAASTNLDFVPVTPQRIADTRAAWLDPRGTGAVVGAGRTLEVTVVERGGWSVPADASAVSLNVTVVSPKGPGYVTAYPCGEARPKASNLNFVTGQTVPNAVISGVGQGGKVCFFASSATHLVVDLNGYMPADSEYYGLVPQRAADTRDGTGVRQGFLPAGKTLRVPVGGKFVPEEALAATLNVTVTQPAQAGHVTVYPCDEPKPLASNLNFAAGQTVPNMVVSPLSLTDGSVCVYSNVKSHIVVDVNGFFSDWAEYVPFTPERWADTRPGKSALGRLTVTTAANYPTPQGKYYEIQIADPGEVDAVSLNVTATQPAASGYVTVFGCESGWTGSGVHTDHGARWTPWLPSTSSLNYKAGQTVANAVVTPVDAHGYVCFYTSSPTHLVVDANGAFLASE